MTRIGARAICRHCGAEIEYHGKAHGWIDHGSGRKCGPYEDRQLNRIVKPRTHHRPDYREFD